jgi:hypothetical protein
VASNSISEIINLLVATFPAKHVKATVNHFLNATSDFSQKDWEDCIAKAGKFVEAILKAIATHCGVPFESGRKFKADAIIVALSQLPQGSHDDALRLLMPRACRVIYDIASNRGARHDPDEIDPNSMDANFVMAIASWTLAEAIRYAQKGAVDPTTARDLVESLVERKYPVLEEVDGRIYLHAKKKSAVDVALVALARRFPKRVDRDALIGIIKANGFTEMNAKVAVQRVAKFADDDGKGRLRLLATGLERAESIVGDALAKKRSDRG